MPRQKRREAIIDLSLGVGIPVVVMVLRAYAYTHSDALDAHRISDYVVQGRGKRTRTRDMGAMIWYERFSAVMEVEESGEAQSVCSRRWRIDRGKAAL